MGQGRTRWNERQVQQGQGTAEEGTTVKSGALSEAEERAWSTSRTQQMVLYC